MKRIFYFCWATTSHWKNLWLWLGGDPLPLSGPVENRVAIFKELQGGLIPNAVRYLSAKKGTTFPTRYTQLVNTLNQLIPFLSQLAIDLGSSSLKDAVTLSAQVSQVLGDLQTDIPTVPMKYRDGCDADMRHTHHLQA